MSPGISSVIQRFLASLPVFPRMPPMHPATLMILWKPVTMMGL
jgi:hypothetical protein